MFITYDIARVLVSDHQRMLRHETEGRRLGRAGRRARRHSPTSAV